MNILVFSWRGPKHPLVGGAEQVDHEHQKGWVEAGHNVTLFTSSFPGAKLEEFIDGVKILRKGSQYLTCHISAFLWYKFSEHGKFDLVVDEFHGWPFFTPLYINEHKLAVIQETTREVWFKYQLSYGLNYVFGIIGYLLEPLFFLPYKKVHFMTGSKSAKDDLVEFGIKRNQITIVPHGVILDLPRKNPRKDSIKTIIFLGALAKDKGIEDAIKVFGILNKLGEYQYWVVGQSDKDYLTFLKKLARKEKVDVRFFGFVTQSKKFDLLARSHIMLNPSVREGWGLVNIEANSVGIPVIAYNSPGLVDSVKDGVSGVICKGNTPQELANEILGLLGDKVRYEKLRKGAISWSKRFSWKRSREKSVNLIEGLVKKQ